MRSAAQLLKDRPDTPVYANAAAQESGNRQLIDAVDQLTSDIEAFKAANEETVRQLKKDGVAHPETTAKVEKIETSVTENAAAIDKIAKDIARMSVGGAANDNRQQLLASAARFYSVRNRRRVRPQDAECDVEAYQAYREAFATAARRQFNVENVSAEVRAAMSVGSDPDGGYFAPDEMSSELERRIHDTSPMRGVARVITIGANAWEAPYKSSKGVSGGWVGEKQARTATGTGQVGMQRIETHEQYAYPEVTQTMLDDGVIDIEAFLVDDTEEQMARTENTAFVSGTGALQPRGFLDYSSAAVTTDDATRSWGVLQYVPSGAAGGFPTLSGIPGASDADGLITMIEKLHPTYRPNGQWAMARSAESTVRKLKDGSGRYLIGFGDLRDNAFGFSLLGFPILNFEDMPTIASDSYSIALGDWRRAYLIIDRAGFRVLRDPYTNKPYVGFYITKRVGADVRNFDAIKLMKFAAS